MSASNLVVLIIMDGWGLSDSRDGNAVYLAETPNLDRLYGKFPFTRLASSGEAVGLPEGQMGNSETGHLNIGAGRIVYQEMVRISKSIQEGNFFGNEVLLSAIGKVRENGSALHLMGLLSDGGVHSHNEHLYALLRMARRAGLQDVYIHAVLDGRDVPPSSAAAYLEEVEDVIRELGLGKVATISGRYYTMDRDKRWKRTEKAYRTFVYGEGERARGAMEALQSAYGRGETDEFVRPSVIVTDDGSPAATVKDGDALIFFNFRSDRARQISRAFVDKEFHDFDRGRKPVFPHFTCLTEYDPLLEAPVAFTPEYLNDTLGEVVSRSGLKQLRITETEKYAHVTYFFNGGVEKPFTGEDRMLIPSPEVATYDLKPEMSAPEVTDVVLKAMQKERYGLVVLNYANADMVGHTGKLEAAIKAVETVDTQVGRVAATVLDKNGIVLVTADHGNAETMLAADGTPHTAHTSNDTPLILAAQNGHFSLPPQGKLADIAPTILKLLALPQPESMDGTALI